MKTLIACITLSLMIHVAANAQDLSGLFPFAHYPLINNAYDALGYQNTMELINTVYEGDDGVFFNGKHPVVDQGGAWARTYYMSALYEQKFAVQVEFRIDDLDGTVRCVVVCGLSPVKQYLGLFLLESNEFSILLSNSVLIDQTDLNPQENVWYKFTMIYDTLSNNAKFYLGTNLIESANHQLDRTLFDGYVSNLYYGGGYPLEGNWRNLRIYGSEEVTALEEEFDRAAQISVFPNPANESIIMDGKDDGFKKWKIGNNDGKILLSGIYSHQDPIDVVDIIPGSYFIQFLDEKGKIITTKQFVKN